MSMSSQGCNLTHLSEPFIQGAQLSFAQHRSSGCFAGEGIATMPPRVHHKKCHITITEVIIMLSWNARFVIAVSIVNTERIISICERWRVIGLAGIVVDELQAS